MRRGGGEIHEETCAACAFHGKGRGKGKGGTMNRRRGLRGRGIAAFIASPTNDEYDGLFYGGKGKSRGRRATGKGKGEKAQPHRQGRP